MDGSLGGYLTRDLECSCPQQRCGVCPWGAVRVMCVAWGRPLARWVLLGAVLGSRHTSSSPISLSQLGWPHGCNLGVVNTSGEFLN